MTPGVRCVRIRENARIGVGTVITETEMLPFLVDPGSENALKLKQLVTANTPLYRLPAQGQSTPKSKVLLSDAARDAKIVKKAEKKKELAAQRAEAAKARDDAAKARDRTFHCKACDRPFLTERHGMAHQASCGGKRVVPKPVSGKAALAVVGSTGRLGVAPDSGATCAAYSALTTEYPSTVSMFAHCGLPRLPTSVLQQGYARNSGRGPTIRFDDEQKSFMREMYARGDFAQGGKKAEKVTPEHAEKLMKAKFPRDRQLTAMQIRGYYQNIKAKQKKEEQGRHQAELQRAWDAAAAGLRWRREGHVQADGAELTRDERAQLSKEGDASGFLRAVVRWTTPCSPGLTVDSEGRVESVEPDGGAQHAGVLVGDIIIKHNDDYLDCVSAAARPSIVQRARAEHVLLLRRPETAACVEHTVDEAHTAGASAVQASPEPTLTPKRKKGSSAQGTKKKAKASTPSETVPVLPPEQPQSAPLPPSSPKRAPKRRPAASRTAPEKRRKPSCVLESTEKVAQHFLQVDCSGQRNRRRSQYLYDDAD